MGLRKLALLGAAIASACVFATASAQAQNEQFIPGLVYRTGAYAPNGIPFANGVADYLTMINARDGGINGVKILFEECETGYATDRGVECYERLKGKGPTGAAYFSPLSTGITFALTEKAPGDKIPLLTMGYGRADSRDGCVFAWNFPLMGTYWTAADVAIQHVAKEWGGVDKLKGKKIALVYHDSPYGKEPIAALEIAGEEVRLRVPADPGARIPAPSRSRSGCRSARPAGLRAAVGLGRHELGLDQRGGQRQLSARQDAGRVVVGRRARRAAGRRQGHGLQGADAAARLGQVRRLCRPREVRRSRRASRWPSPTRSARCSTIAA